MQIGEDEKRRRRKQLIVYGFVIPIMIGTVVAWVGLSQRLPLSFKDDPLFNLLILLLTIALTSAYFVGQAWVIIHWSWRRVDKQRAEQQRADSPEEKR